MIIIKNNSSYIYIYNFNHRTHHRITAALPWSIGTRHRCTGAPPEPPGTPQWCENHQNSHGFLGARLHNVRDELTDCPLRTKRLGKILRREKYGGLA